MIVAVDKSNCWYDLMRKARENANAATDPEVKSQIIGSVVIRKSMNMNGRQNALSRSMIVVVIVVALNVVPARCFLNVLANPWEMPAVKISINGENIIPVIVSGKYGITEGR